MYVEDYFKLYMGILIGGLFLLLGVALFFSFSPVQAEWDCQPFLNEGHDVKVVVQSPFGYECWINDGSEYVPLKKWLTINGGV